MRLHIRLTVQKHNWQCRQTRRRICISVNISH